MEYKSHRKKGLDRIISQQKSASNAFQEKRGKKKNEKDLSDPDEAKH